ncbi:MarR family winged helix-turn-helix transcriptional regulator [Clostridium lacusfryxellense]|uniref:MarR family winged helix-turn-helix transcriptional regulator n=1 Tax=Clostridium lacusfryxellense TaxID=205328 RepID=UPI001C0E5529|nr:MarR family transcriptional regulator [Clostridium lacusfryxellense]MBU3113556.1 MarR family transcriptional regulator [Clostridium lacusfryxellense]
MKDWFDNSAKTIALFCRMYINVKRDLPIRNSEMGVIIFVDKYDGEVTPNAITEFLKISKPSVTVKIRALVEKEYVYKKYSKVDKRSYTLHLTPKAKHLVGLTDNDYYKLINALSNGMGEDNFLQLIHLMEFANNVLNEYY